MSQPYHIYLDLDVLDNDVASGAKPHPLVFEETRNTPCLDGDASNYFCSIVRFSIQTGSSSPVFIPRIDGPRQDPNATVYKITLAYQSKTITQAMSVFWQVKIQNRTPVQNIITSKTTRTSSA